MKAKLLRMIVLPALLLLCQGTASAAITGGRSGDESKDLQALVDSYTFGPEDYTYGTCPGMVGNSTIYADFFNTFSEAMQLLGSASSTDEEKAAMYDRLVAAKAKVDSAMLPISDGVYYIVTGNTMFTDTMAWYAPHTTGGAGWTRLKHNSVFMWDIRTLQDGTFSVRNIATGQYAAHCANIDQSFSAMTMTDSLAMGQVFERVAPNGQFTVRASGAAWYYNTEGHQNGAGTAGPLASWINNAKGSECCWRLIPVSAAEVAAAAATTYSDLLAPYIASLPTNYTTGTDPGYYSAGAYAAYTAKLSAARTLIEGAHDEASCREAYTSLRDAKAELEASASTISDGIYSISSMPYDSIAGSTRTASAWMQEGTNGYLRSAVWSTREPQCLWRITSLGNGTYSVQNYTGGMYVGAAELMVNTAHIKLTATQSTPQTFTLISGTPQFVPGNPFATEKGFSYVSDGANIVLGTTAQGVCLHRYTEDEAKAIVSSYDSQLVNDSLRSLCAIVEKAISGTRTLDYDKPVVTDASQFYCNNKEATEGTYEALIDGVTDDDSKFFHSSWSGTAESLANEYHYLRIYSENGLPEEFGFTFCNRNQTGYSFAPAKMEISVSSDGESWTVVDTIENTTISLFGHVRYTSPTFTGLSAYKYFKITTLTTPTNWLDPNGHPYFCLTEFNMYPLKLAQNSDEVVSAVEGMQTCLSDVKPHTESNTATWADITRLNDAYHTFLLSWQDTTHITTLIGNISAYMVHVEPGTEGSLFLFPQTAIDKMYDAIGQVDGLTFTGMPQSRVAELDTLLSNAFRELRTSMYAPDTTRWYYLETYDSQSLDRFGNPIFGQKAWMGGYTSADGLGAGNDSTAIDLDHDPRCAWMFRPAGEPGRYYMINCGSGFPETREPVILTPLGEGQFSIASTAYNNGIYTIHTDVLPGVPIDAATAVTPEGYGPCAWYLEPADESLTYTRSLRAGSYNGMVLPYDTKGLPVGANGETVDTYEVCGYVTAPEDSVITGIRLRKFSGSYIPAGTPFVVKAEGDYSIRSYVTVDFLARVGSPISRAITPANGLTATYDNIALDGGAIYFAKDSAYVSTASYTIIPQQSYIDLSRLTNGAPSADDIIVPVSGRVKSTATGIAPTIISGSGSRVNVYTTDGVMVRRQVSRDEALRGIGKGIYIIGGEKHVVR